MRDFLFPWSLVFMPSSFPCLSLDWPLCLRDVPSDFLIGIQVLWSCCWSRDGIAATAREICYDKFVSWGFMRRGKEFVLGDDVPAKLETSLSGLASLKSSCLHKLRRKESETVLMMLRRREEESVGEIERRGERKQFREDWEERSGLQESRSSNSVLAHSREQKKTQDEPWFRRLTWRRTWQTNYSWSFFSILSINLFFQRWARWSRQ